jgi:hypothetical protein
VDRDLEKEIKKIIGEIQCPNEFCCLESGGEIGCRAKDVGLEEYLECLQESFPPLSVFSVFW